MRRYYFILGLVILSGLASSGLAYFWLKSVYNAPGPLKVPVTIIIPKGFSPKAISVSLKRAGVIDDLYTFNFGLRILSQQRPLRAGEFSFKPGMSAADVIAHLQTGKTILRKLTIAEGLNNAQIVRMLKNTPGLTGSIDQLPEEGLLLPETYYFAFGDSRASIIKRMKSAMSRLINKVWAGRIPDLPLKSQKEALVLASIIEKETGIDSERSRIAGVFVNRLRLGMRLQSDPTVIFGITGGRDLLGRGITKSDLRMETPYNTYLINGLPPGPITNPGRAAIMAALNPLDTKDLYFVADGKGGHSFAQSLEGHLRNVTEWRKIERMRRKAND